MSGKLRLAIELKGPPAVVRGLAEGVVAARHDHWMVQEAIVISFDHRSLRAVKALEPAVTTGILYVARLADPVAAARAVGADLVLPLWLYLDRETVKEAQAAGLGVWAWVVNEPAALRRVLDMGVDAVTTDYPDRLRQFVDAR